MEKTIRQELLYHSSRAKLDPVLRIGVNCLFVNKQLY